MDIYYNTGTTKFTFNDGLVTRLAKLPNVAAVKMPLLADGDFARDGVAAGDHPEGFAIGHSGGLGSSRRPAGWL